MSFEGASNADYVVGQVHAMKPPIRVTPGKRALSHRTGPCVLGSGLGHTGLLHGPRCNLLKSLEQVILPPPQGPPPPHRCC
jgi:hypothetical protein